MEWRVDHRPSYGLLKVKLDPGESVTAEPGAMVFMRGDIEVKTHTGGIGSAILRKLAGGESIWMNTFIARSSGAEVWFAPSLPGDIEYIELRGRPVVVQDMSYLAHHGDAKISVAWRGFKGLLAEGELFWLKIEGAGGVWVNSYGGIDKLELGPGEKVIIDNFHFVAMDASMKWRTRKFGGLKSFLAGGEGIVFEIEGPGTLLLQSRSLPPFIRLLRKYFKK